MGMMLVERHQASFFGKLLESCRAAKGRDSTPTDEARRSLARWARTDGHARPSMQRRGQTGAGFWGVLGKVKSLPEAKARAVADFFATETENHDLGLLVAEVKTSLTRQGLRFGAPSEVEVRFADASVLVAVRVLSGLSFSRTQCYLPQLAKWVFPSVVVYGRFRVIYLVNRVLLLLVTATTTLLLYLPVVQTRDGMYPPLL